AMRQPFGANHVRSCVRLMPWIAANHRRDHAGSVSMIIPSDTNAMIADFDSAMRRFDGLPLSTLFLKFHSKCMLNEEVHLAANSSGNSSGRCGVLFGAQVPIICDFHVHRKPARDQSPRGAQLDATAAIRAR